EELEQRAPLRIRGLSVRRGSGGRGKHRGGDGLRKEVEVLESLRGAFLGERHEAGPPGSAGGSAGAPGRLFIERGGKRKRLPAKTSFDLGKGDVLIVETPGGGGHGKV
ncbi:MAG: N-methylhydantoinase B/oxoprolinase/acetone carboxylase alpha subunit, partial [Planctomycetota bacterium]